MAEPDYSNRWRTRNLIRIFFMKKKRVVITGIGVISPIGIGKDCFWQALKTGKSGIKPITLFDVSKYKVRVGGEISDFDPAVILEKEDYWILTAQQNCF